MPVSVYTIERDTGPETRPEATCLLGDRAADCTREILHVPGGREKRVSVGPEARTRSELSTCIVAKELRTNHTSFPEHGKTLHTG